MANYAPEETELVSSAVVWLRGRLPQGWTVEPTSRVLAVRPAATQEPLGDAAIDVRTPSGQSTTMVVEAKRSFTPRDAEMLLPRIARVLRSLAGETPVLVVAPWLSSRTREMLEAQEANYIDLTGNALVVLANPTVYVRTQGSDRNPEPDARPRARIRGAKAGRLIRLLVDVRPPYGVTDLAAATRLNPGYVSRLIDALDAEALVERKPRGNVTSVDIAGLLRRWTETYDVFRANGASRYLAPRGAASALADLSASGQFGQVAVTGSFAASRLAPVAAPALLLAYVEDSQPAAEVLGFLPTDSGANVALLSRFDPVVFERTTERNGVRYVAPSQVAVDCLTGNGRMPAEGAAVVQWMLEDEQRWRLPSLRALDPSLGDA
ncbi:MAG: hypothetical protein ACYDAC_02505 [Candidatus Dormibacteria bacterium]